MKNEEKKTLAQRLGEVQQRLHVAKKNVNQHLKANYRTTSDILLQVKPLLAEAGLVLVMYDEVEYVGTRIYVKTTAEISCPDTGEHICGYGFAREDENRAGISQAQCTGASSTYARKYALQGLFLIDDSEADPDRDENCRNFEARNEAEALQMVAVARSLADLTAIYRANPQFCTPGGAVMQALSNRKQTLTN